ncbi:MAG: type I polyketide synthase [Pseudomonadota bacterium]
MPDTSPPPIQAKPTVSAEAATQLRRAMGAVQDMRARLDAVQARAHEPIAIVGMSGRFPGGDDLASWWQTLVQGHDAVGLVPPERWDREALYDADPDAPGKMNTRWGGFIKDVEMFDATFFGISPREALSVDPQQRLLLELTWHALEDAGQAPDQLAGSRTGVYLGISNNDYSRVVGDRDSSEWIDAHASTGNSVAVAAGRLSYSLGLQGPAMAIDTACSSSLVAVHQAVRALRSGEITQAIAAGVNLVLLPELTIGFSKARMMAADGRCKTFDAAADGYVRGEGCGVLILKRLSDALAAGDTIHALVAGSAVNHDGRSNGLTAPNGPAQVAVIRAALADAQVKASQVSYIEAHGTGTSLGDPIEARALATVFGDRPDTLLGSVKTQIGHLEAAAGIAGLIKLALCLRERTIAPHLHFHTLNPHIAEDGFPFRVPTSATPWQALDGRWIGGVSSFGFSGTNAHVILEAAPQAKASDTPVRPVQVLPLSARDPAALAALRSDVAAALLKPGLDLQAFAATLGAGRAHHAHRLAVVADSAAAAHAALASVKPVRSGEPPMVAFLFTGQGCQYPGMARGLLAEPLFCEILARCDAALAGRLPLPIADMIRAGADTDFSRTDILQPVLFAIEYAVAELWRSWGVMPAAVIGHSLGEIAAACFAGAMELEAALQFVAERSRLMQLCKGKGSMAAVLAPADRVSAMIQGSGAVIAGYNALNSCVIAGETAAFARAVALLDENALAWQPLEVATAFHSPALDSCLDELEQAAAQMPMRPAQLPIASNLSGSCIHEFDAAYWRRQAREPVRFIQGLQALGERGCSVFLEVGPHAVLSGLGRSALPKASFIPSLKRGADDQRTVSDALAQLYALGVPVNWSGRFAKGQGRAAAPGYPFQRERFWPAAHPAGVPSAAALPRPGQQRQLLPGTHIATPLAQTLYEADVSVASMPFLADHVVFGQVVVPGAMHAVMVLAALRAEGKAHAALEDLVFEQALTVPEGGVRAQLVLEPDGEFALSGLAPGASWVRHASGRAFEHADSSPARLDISAIQSGLVRDEVGPGALFSMLAERGIVLGPAFQGACALWRGQGEALAEIRLPAMLNAESAGLPIHPAMLDACFQTLGATFTGPGSEGGFLPLSIDRIRIWRNAPERLFCHVRSGSAGASGQVAMGDFTLCDESGQVVISIEGLQIKRVEAPPPRDPLEGAFLALDWVPADLGEPDWAMPSALLEAARPLVSPDTPAAANALADGLEQLARACSADAWFELGAAALAPVADPSKTRLLRRVGQLAALHGASSGGAGMQVAQKLRHAHPDNGAEIDLVARCGAGLAGVLRGQIDPLQLIFPDTSQEQQGIYGAAGLAQTANQMAAAAVAAAVARRAGRPLRVLEIGGGTGATTELVLPKVLAAQGSSYLFTDISPAFLKAAKTRFGESINTALLDLEQPLQAQHIAPGSFDIVVAANVVHATADVLLSLSHMRELLAPGGSLVLVESTHPQQWWDIVFGLTDGWWRFTDTALRPDHPLLMQQAWHKVFARAGFAASASVGADKEARLSLLVASTPQREVIAVHDGREGASKDLAQSLAAELGCQLMGAEEAIRQLSLPAPDSSAARPAIVYTGGVGRPDNSSQQAADRSPLHQAFDLARAMALTGRERLYLVTRGARGASQVTDPDNASLWGLGQVAALEHPELQCRCLDLDPQGTHSALQLARELQADDGENAVSWRGGRRFAKRLVDAALPPATDSVTFDANGTCLVLGAFGGLGPLLAEWLVAHGAKTLVLVGRREPSAALAAQLRGLTATVHLHCADVSDHGAMAALLHDIKTGMPPLRSVFHLAGSVADGALVKQDWPRFSSVLGAKADSARILDVLTRDLPLQHFVLFSTSAALIGNLGQANHAAANTCLDALAHHRRELGLPGLSINWGAWSGAGAVIDGDYAERMAASGVRTMAPEAGFDALARAMAADRAQIGVVPLDWPKFLAAYGDRVPVFFSRMAVRAAGSQRTVAAGTRNHQPTVDLRALLAGTAPEQRREQLQFFLAAEAAAVLGMADASRVDPDHPLNELGLDSLLALELRTRLGTAVGKKQAATLLFNYPSVAALTQFFAQELIGPDAEEPVIKNTAAQDSLSESIAGMSEAELEALINDELNALS